MRLMVLCSSHSTAPGFLHKAINIDFNKFWAMCPGSDMPFMSEIIVLFQIFLRLQSLLSIYYQAHHIV